MNRLDGALARYADLQWRRVLTQMDRDPDSPTFGCFDRQYWHYKTRDFPSALLQQGVFTVEALRLGHIPSAIPRHMTERWSVAAINAIGKAVNRFGGVDEYYPFEHSYPSAAFCLYTAVVLLRKWDREEPRLAALVDKEPLAVLARHVAARTELQASNQRAIGLAALAIASRFAGFESATAGVHEHADAFFASQHSEGWFEEYGGPDFGYLTVTLDALADYYSATQDPRALDASARAVHFVAHVIGCDGRLPSTLNSRNTDYAVPYGLACMSQQDATASWILNRLFRDADRPNHHFLWPIDDRYHTHYVFASIVRALPLLPAVTAPVEPAHSDIEWLPDCGFWIRRTSEWTLFVGARKGGIARLHRANGIPTQVDHGWRLRDRTGLWTTNWQGCSRASREPQSNFIEIVGEPHQIRYHVSGPLKAIFLRVAAFVLRQRLIPILKRILIFAHEPANGRSFTRRVEVSGASVAIADQFAGFSDYRGARAPRQNVRYVASADSYADEEALDRQEEGETLEWGL